MAEENHGPYSHPDYRGLNSFRGYHHPPSGQAGHRLHSISEEMDVDHENTLAPSDVPHDDPMEDRDHMPPFVDYEQEWADWMNSFA